MLKSITVIFLSLFIFCVVIFTFFYVSFHLNISVLNSVNDNSRKTFRQNQLLRTIFRLSDRGDARSDYYQPSPYSRLTFEVFSGSSGGLYPGSVDLLKTGLGDVINKPGGIRIAEKNLDNIPPIVDNQYLESLAKSFPDYTSDTAVIRIYVLSSFKDAPDILGQTIGAYSFAIFKNTVEKNDSGGLDAQDLEKEIILHEIGHLLGANHIPNQDCVMNAYVDSTDTFTLTFTPTSYCSADISVIREANY